MAKESGPMSGFRDMLAEQMIPRQEVLDTIRGVYEGYGFVPLKTPALERLETMTGKYGEEGDKLMYKFQDNGGRDVAMRYDQTVPLARVVAQHANELPRPYKRYALGEVWRGESPQAGRYREFTQFDADTVGSTSYLADTEIIAMMHDSMDSLSLNTVIRVNDRRLLDGLAVECGVDADKGFRQLVGIIDNYDKIGHESVLSEVNEKFGDQAGKVVEQYLNVSGNTDDKLNMLKDILTSEIASNGIESLQKIMGALAFSGYSDDQIIFDQTIARGLDYYTSTIYETNLVDLPGIGSVCSGGRFDNLIEAMGGPQTPAVGTSIGVDRLIEGMRQLNLLKESRTKTKVVIASMGSELDNDRFAMVQELRHQGIPAELIFEDKKLAKQIGMVDKLGVEHVILYGANEKDDKVVTIKNLQTREQVTILKDKIIDYFNKEEGTIE